MRVPSPAVLPQRHAQALCRPAQAFCASSAANPADPSAREDPALTGKGEGPHPEVVWGEGEGNI